MGGRGGNSPGGDSSISHHFARKNVTEWAIDPDGWITVKDLYPGGPGVDPSDPKWDNFIHWLIHGPASLPGDDKTLQKAGVFAWLVGMVGLYLLLDPDPWAGPKH